MLVEKKGLIPERMRVAAYWRRGEAGFHETLASPPGWSFQ